MQLPETSHTAASNVVRLADGSRKTRVLYAGDMEFARAQFASVAPQLQLIPAPAAGAADNAAAEAPDVALIDCGAPGVDARSVAEGIRGRGLDIPIVLALDPATAGENGASRVTAELRVDDYTVKLPGWLARLPARLEFAIAHHRRRRSLDTVQASAERLRTVVESAPVCLARVARDGTILAMNDASMKMVGADAPEDVLGKSLLTLVASNATDPVRRFLDAVSAGQPGSLEFETVAGGASRIVDARAVPLSADTEGRASALLVLRDATERKRLEDSVVATALAAAKPAAADGFAAERDRLRGELEAAVADRRHVESERDALRAEIEEARARAAMVDHVRAACTTAEQELSRLQGDYRHLVAERDRLLEDLAGTKLRQETTATEHQAQRDADQAQRQADDAARAKLAARCETLEGMVRTLEAAQAAEREQHSTVRSQAEQAGLLAGERESLLASLGTLRGRFDEMSLALDASEARHAAEIQAHQHAAEAANARAREVEQARAGLNAQLAEAAAARQSLEGRLADLEGQAKALAAERDGLRTALEAARTTIGELEAVVRDSRAGRDARLANAEGIRDALQQRVKELDAQVSAVAAERDQLRAGVDAAYTTVARLEAAVGEAAAGRDVQLAAAMSAREGLERQAQDLQARLEVVAAERDQLHASLDEARVAVERLEGAAREAGTGRDAQLAAAVSAREALEHQSRDLQARLEVTVAERDAVREELDETVRAAHARHQQLQASIEDIRASRDTQAAQAEAVRRQLAERIEQLQARIEASTAERDALHKEMRFALEAANTRSAQLQASLADIGAAAHGAVADGAREALAARVDELQARLAAAIEERDALERALETARTGHEVQLREASATRETLEARIAERHAENGRLLAQIAALQTDGEPRADAAARSAAAPAAGMHDAQTAFREAVQLLSGELHTAVEATRAQQALLLGQPGGYHLVEERLRQAEADCHRIAAERDEREATVRALQAEIQQLVELRREQRRELVRALQESEEAERRAAARLAECVRLRQMLGEAQAVLQRLSRWAATQSTRLAPSTTAPRPAAAEAPSTTAGKADTATPGAPLEESWS